MKRIRYPFPVLASSMVLLLIPLLAYWITAGRQSIPVWEYSRVLALYNPFQIVLNLFLWVVAIGMLMVQRWAYISFLVLGFSFSAYCLVLLMGNLLGVFTYRFGGKDYAILLLLSSVTAMFLTNMVRKKLSMPYLALVGRGWRMSQRENLRLPIVMKSSLGVEIHSVTDNVSTTGCLVPLLDKGEVAFMMGERITCELELEPGSGKDPIILSGEVVRLAYSERTGTSFAGIAFSEPTGEAHFSDSSDRSNELEAIRKGLSVLKNFLDKKYTPRYSVDFPSKVIPLTEGSSVGGEVSEGKLYNLSYSGIYVESDTLYENDAVLSVEVYSWVGRIVVEGRVVWGNPDAKFHKKKGYGFEINSHKNPIRFFLLVMVLFVRDDVRR